MDVFLVRHAEAEPARPGLSDGERALTSRGVQRFTGAVAGLERLGVGFDRIHHSPLLRAMETAELLAPLLGEDGETVVDPGLARAPERGWIASITGERVALVGHEPWLSELLAMLLLGWQVVDGGGPGPFAFEKGGVAWLVGEPRAGAMTLRELYSPKALRRLGR